MCDYSGKLIAWLDQELPEVEAADVERHVGQCAECRSAVSSYRQISEAFLGSYEAGLTMRPQRNPWRWAALAGGIAASVLLAALLPRPHPEQLPPLPQAMHAPAMAFEKVPVRIVAVHRRRAAIPVPMPKPQWTAAEPTVEIALPAEAFFPPGAVPAGFSFIADIRPQP